MPNVIDKKVKVIRILVYTGKAEKVFDTLRKGAVPPNGEHDTGDLLIQSAIIGWPELLEEGCTLPEFTQGETSA